MKAGGRIAIRETGRERQDSGQRGGSRAGADTRGSCAGLFTKKSAFDLAVGEVAGVSVGDFSNSRSIPH
jgi:hypothetical protein